MSRVPRELDNGNFRLSVLVQKMNEENVELRKRIVAHSEFMAAEESRLSECRRLTREAFMVIKFASKAPGILPETEDLMGKASAILRQISARLK